MEVGGGFYFEGVIFDAIGAKIGFKGDYARIHLNDGELFVDQDTGTYFAFTIIGLEFGDAESSYKRWGDTEWTDESWIGVNPNQDNISLLSGGVYLMIVGGTFDICFDFGHFFEGLEGIFG